jgi:hypothetical protein
MAKKCFKCKRIKKLDEFYTHKQMADGHLGKCKSCTKSDAKIRFANPEARERIRLYDIQRSHNPARRIKIAIYRKRSRQRNRGKFRARSKINNAIRDGRLTRRACQICGAPNSQAHHTDYRRPLAVRWLCFKHHREAHGEKPVIK